MKRMIAGLLTVLACGSAMAQHDKAAGLTGEFAGNGYVYFPGAGDFDLYDIGYGAELQYRNWFDAPMGWAVSAGWATWEANSSSSDLGVPNFHSYKGSVTLIPVGASGLYRLIDAEGFALTLEVGLRYVIVEDDIDVKDANRADARQNLDIDDGVVGVLAVDADFQINESAALAVGVGYQPDILKGEMSIGTTNLKDNELQAFFVRAGVKFQF